MIAHQVKPEEVEALVHAHAEAQMHCDLNAPPAPHEGLLHSQADHGYAFVTDGLSASAVVRDAAGEIMWFTHLHGDPAANLAALCDAIHDAFGVDPWGTMRNPETRAAVAQANLHEDPDNPEHVTWRRNG